MASATIDPEEIFPNTIQKSNDLEKELQTLKNPQKAQVYAWFFKTGKGQYGEGDVFLGITVPVQRQIAKKYPDLELSDIQKLLSSKIHEHRLTSLIILVDKYKKANDNEKGKIAKFYLKNAKNINNWDLVDSSAEYILGNYLIDRDKSILYKFAKSKDLWQRRIAIISTFHFIKSKKFDDTLKISLILLKDSHDLIHKAVGWMLREVGKRDQKALEKFLQKYTRVMPRTMLRYSIERFDQQKRKRYLTSQT